jgi:tyrosyl-tRNA synthetase
MGKTASGAIWLDEKLLDPYEYFQYFRNSNDLDVIKFLKLFTDLDLLEIDKYENFYGQELNPIKEILAFETTKICHGKEIADNILQKSREIFLNKNAQAFEKKIINSHNQNKKIIDIIFEINATESKADAKRLIEGKAVKINGELVEDINLSFTNNQQFELTIGKKKHFQIVIN